MTDEPSRSRRATPRAGSEPREEVEREGGVAPTSATVNALEPSDDLYRLLVQSVRDYAIFVLDPEGRVSSWNEGAQRIKGYTAEEIVGRHFSTFYLADEVVQDKPGMELRVAAAEGRFEDEGWRVRKDGSLFWANVVITALRDETGSLVGYAKVTRDLTERRASQERAIADARRLADAEASSRAKSEFLATMSHELRTPLNAIAGYVELLDLGLRGPITAEQRDDLDKIRRSQRHLLGIINDLLNFSRIEAGQVTYDFEPVDLASVVDMVAAMIEPQAISKGLHLEREAIGANVVARSDRAKVEQILLNLLSNAIKFTQPGGRITTSAAVGEGTVMLRVADTGIGIPADKLDDIFQPFVQLGRSLSTSHQGTGLGLAISRDLAQALGGDITATSTVGVGSVFTLTLPREDRWDE